MTCFLPIVVGKLMNMIFNFVIFSNFKFACYGHLQRKWIIVHVYIQSLLRVDGSILAGVFLTSSWSSVVPQSSYSSNAAISSLLVDWSSNCPVAGRTFISWISLPAILVVKITGGSSTLRTWWRSYRYTFNFAHCLHSFTLLNTGPP